MHNYQGIDLTFDLTGKVAVVTGGGSGIGKASAKLLHDKGAKTILVDVCENLSAVAAEIGPNASPLHLDITKVDQVRIAIDRVVRETGGIDILLNIAGLGHGAYAEEVTEEDWDRVMAVNIKGLFFMAQAVGRAMIGQARVEKSSTWRHRRD